MRKQNNYTGRPNRTSWWLVIVTWAIMVVTLLTTNANAVGL